MTSLDRLRGNFGPKMTASPDGSAFAVIAQRIDEHGVAFRDQAAHRFLAYSFSDWPRGLYSTQTLVGTRAGGGPFREVELRPSRQVNQEVALVAGLR